MEEKTIRYRHDPVRADLYEHFLENELPPVYGKIHPNKIIKYLLRHRGIDLSTVKGFKATQSFETGGIRVKYRCAIALRKINWNYVPQWKKNKDLVKRRFK